MSIWNAVRRFITSNDIKTPEGGFFHPIGMGHSIARGGHDLAYIQQNPLLFTGVSKFADFFCNAHIFVSDLDDVPIDNDPLDKLIENPNNLQTKREFMRAWLFQMKADGVSWITSLGGVGFQDNPERTSLVVLPCLEIETKYDSRQLELDPERIKEVKFIYCSSNGERITLNFDDLMFSVDSTSSAIAPFDYLAPIKALSLVAANNQLRLEADNVLTGKPGGLGILSSRPSGSGDFGGLPMSPEQKKRIEKKLSSRGVYGVGRGKSEIIATAASVHFESIAQTIKAFDLTAGTDRDYIQVANVLGMHKNLLIADSKYQDYLRAQIDLYQNGASNAAQLFCDTITDYFDYREQSKKLSFSYDHVPVMSTVKNEQADYKIKMLDFYARAKELGGDENLINERITELI